MFLYQKISRKYRSFSLRYGAVVRASPFHLRWFVTFGSCEESVKNLPEVLDFLQAYCYSEVDREG